MTEDRRAGLLLIFGSLCGIITMAIHPTGRATLTATEIERLATVSAIAHSLAMVSFLATFLGTIQLTFHLASRQTSLRKEHIALSALVTYAFSATALLIAAAVSGFVVPGIMRQMAADQTANAAQWRLTIAAVFQFNQAFARIYSVAASMAITLWSASALRNGGLGRGIATYGCIVPPVLVVLIAVGHLRLNVHGMAVVMLGHAIWFLLVGAQLHKPPPDP